MIDSEHPTVLQSLIPFFPFEKEKPYSPRFHCYYYSIYKNSPPQSSQQFFYRLYFKAFQTVF